MWCTLDYGPSLEHNSILLVTTKMRQQQQQQERKVRQYTTIDYNDINQQKRGHLHSTAAQCSLTCIQSRPKLTSDLRKFSTKLAVPKRRNLWQTGTTEWIKWQMSRWEKMRSQISSGMARLRSISCRLAPFAGKKLTTSKISLLFSEDILGYFFISAKFDSQPSLMSSSGIAHLENMHENLKRHKSTGKIVPRHVQGAKSIARRRLHIFLSQYGLVW